MTLRDAEGEPINQTLNSRGEWVPSIPEPFWIGRRFRSFVPVCTQCSNRKFKDLEAYKGHYALVHILGLS